LVSGTKLDPSKVTADDIVGGVSISTGAETGLEVVRQVYPKTGYVPGILLAPRFSRNANVCAALQAKCRSINSVFNCVCFVDIDSTAEGAVKYQDVAAQKVAQAATSREAYGLWPYCKVATWHTAAVRWLPLLLSTTIPSTATCPTPARP